jgi:hypothetical protein
MLKIQIQGMKMEQAATTNRKLYLLSKKTHTFAQFSSVINIMGGEYVFPGNQIEKK